MENVLNRIKDIVKEANEKHHGCDQECYDCVTFPNLDEIVELLEAYKQSLEPVEGDALDALSDLENGLNEFKEMENRANSYEDGFKITGGLSQDTNNLENKIKTIRNQLTRQGEVDISRFNEQGLVEGLFKQYIPPEKCSDDIPFMTENEIHSYNLAVKTLYENGQLKTQPQKQVDDEYLGDNCIEELLVQSQKQVDVESLIAKYSHSVYPDCRDLDSDTPFARTMRELSSKGYLTKPQPIEGLEEAIEYFKKWENVLQACNTDTGKPNTTKKVLKHISAIEDAVIAYHKLTKEGV